jgi:hypothetical protein
VADDDGAAEFPRRRHRRVVRPGTGPQQPEEHDASTPAPDDGDVGWERPGDAEQGGRDDDWYRRERPPHW